MLDAKVEALLADGQVKAWVHEGRSKGNGRWSRRAQANWVMDKVQFRRFGDDRFSLMTEQYRAMHAEVVALLSQ